MVIAYKSLPAYRQTFFDDLRSELLAHDVTLDLVHGDPVGVDRLKSDSVLLSWATLRRNRQLTVRGRSLVWQPISDITRGADLVIVEQASKLLINYVLIARQWLGGPKVALWGHGANLQAHTASRVSEALKRRYSRLPHWWFAYTEGSRMRVESLGFPTERITVVQNAVDTVGLRRAITELGEPALTDYRQQLDLVTDWTALFIGSLYADKRLELLIEAADAAHAIDQRFRLLIAGDGPERGFVEEAAGHRPYVTYLGRVDAKDRALALGVADLVLMPGLVGLAILDSFAATAPLIATAADYHSPEIEYLQHGVNGLCLDRHVDAVEYADAVVSTLRDAELLARLRLGCVAASNQFTNDEMVSRFAAGVLLALEAS